MFTDHTGLYTDLYELTMAQGYFFEKRHDQRVAFDYSIRTNPYHSGYTVFAGLADLLSALENFKYSDESCAYLQSLGFREDFLKYLKGFKFQGDILAPCEGEIVFPAEPILRVEGALIETQLVETIILNFLNFQSLIATKAARVRQAAGDALIADFGLRRAQGLGGIQASRACIIGGFNSTSNVYSSFRYGLDPVGTQAHSWIQSYSDELSAFRAYAKYYPERCILLVDTYNTLKSGVPNAIMVAKEMKENGQKLFGIRLDSGDLAYLSKKARVMLDEAGLPDVKIVASNQLDEHLIKSLKEQGAKIDAYGVGTNVIVGRNDAALDGVYKLSVINGQPCMKISENKEKMTIPGQKKVVRLLDEQNQFYADAICLEDESFVDMIFNPLDHEMCVNVADKKQEVIHHQVMKAGQRTREDLPVDKVAEFVQKRLGQLPQEHKRFENPHIYKIGISQKLLDLQTQLIDHIKQQRQNQN